MRKSKFNRKAERAIIKALDTFSRRYGVGETKHAASKWLTVQRVRASVEKERRALEKRLSEINAKLK